MPSAIPTPADDEEARSIAGDSPRGALGKTETLAGDSVAAVWAIIRVYREFVVSRKCAWSGTEGSCGSDRRLW